jgi:hypothetical protein
MRAYLFRDVYEIGGTGLSGVIVGQNAVERIVLPYCILQYRTSPDLSADTILTSPGSFMRGLDWIDKKMDSDRWARVAALRPRRGFDRFQPRQAVQIYRLIGPS